MTEFDEYIRQGEADICRRASYWQIAVGLQDVDRLKPSKYLLDTAQEHIEDRISIGEVSRRISAYYQTKKGRQEGAGTSEADTVAARIVALLAEETFSFAPTMLSSIHRRLFVGVLPHAGEYRTYNISKKEWVLDNASVLYSSADMIAPTLEYDFAQERKVSYVRLSPAELVSHFASFISGIWQIHPFGEGNTRTTAIFAIKYLNQLGYRVGNAPFHQHSWYFRNALVRANYQNVEQGVERTGIFLELFFRNLLWGEHNELRNRYTHIRWGSDRERPSVVSEGVSEANPAAYGDTIATYGDTTGIYDDSTATYFGRPAAIVAPSAAPSAKPKTSVEILRIMRLRPSVTAAAIAEELGRSQRAIEMQIARLANEGKIRRHGPNKGGFWEVLPAPAPPQIEGQKQPRGVKKS